ncbi:MAG: hypothetical protein KGL39_04680 [Patescibacteria group bacterium]|nr:hypothetical protein [Patescibacteria group bacterium]
MQPQGYSAVLAQPTQNQMEAVNGRLSNANETLSANINRIEAALFRLVGEGQGTAKGESPRPIPAGHIGRISETISDTEMLNTRLAIAADLFEKAV